MTEVNFGDWRATRQTTTDQMDPWRCAALHATLDLPGPASAPVAGEALPLLWHWIYFLDTERQSDIGSDGHPRRGGFIPPIELPRRMWAGGALRFHQPLIVGRPARKQSIVTAITQKSGRSGKLYFVTVEHQIYSGDALAIEERQDIVYREAQVAGTNTPQPAQAPEDEDVCQTYTASPTLLMRYSSLTFNAHRIHYDVTYAREVEHYQGLVVHGPLQATLMASLLPSIQSGAGVRGFEFRAQTALFAGDQFHVCGARRKHDTIETFIRNHDGGLTMSGRFSLS